MIFTSRYANPELATGNYTVVGITRSLPRYALQFKLAGNIKDLAPPEYLFNEYIEIASLHGTTNILIRLYKTTPYHF